MATSPSPTPRSPWTGLAFSQLLAFLFFAACLWWMSREFGLILPSHRILLSLDFQAQVGPALGWQLARFATIAWLLHALTGALAFLLARLTELAMPNIRARRLWLVSGWFGLLAALALAANTTWFPASQFAGEWSWWRREVFGLAPVLWAAGALAATALLLLLKARARLPRLRLAGGLAVAVIAVASVSAAWPQPIRHAVAHHPKEAPNFVLIGLDSLRNDLEAPHHGPAVTPHIRAFLQQARRFNDATTPLARTYGAWVSILSGRHPVTTNARVNLMPRALVREGQTLGQALRALGYRSVYATDEVRFANFDASYGFDHLITPPVGAADFILGIAGDLPLVNLAAYGPAGAWLFPSNHANRAADITYHPRQFLRRLERELPAEGPTFLALHLTLGHWPYVWAGMPRPTNHPAYRDSYAVAIAELDRQFDAAMRLLADKGLLDNAIVVLLSDHGEALGAPSDSMLRQTGTDREIWDSLWGHGTSVLSPNQYHVLLAVRAFGRARLPGPNRDYDWPVSLEDIRPTLEEFATGRQPADVDGISLLPYMVDPARASQLSSRIRFTETDFNTPHTLAGRYTASGLVDAAVVYYELDRDTGRVQFRDERLPDLLAQKQRAAFTPTHLLAAVPASKAAGTRYLFTDRAAPSPQPLDAPPSTASGDARRLWDALHERFPGELAGASNPP